MDIPYLSGSGRRPHYWALRSDGFHELLDKNCWQLRGAHLEKTIHGNRVMLTVVEETPQHVLCCLLLREDYWAGLTAQLREKHAKSRRSSFRIIPGD